MSAVEGVTQTAPPARAPEGSTRLAFLDGLRGVALVLMVLNHTSRWWMDVSMGLGRYFLVYGSVLFPAPIFLFLVGFLLPVSYHADPARSGGACALLRRYGARGLRIIAAGLLLNLIVFPEDPVWSWGVLQTIGLSIVVVALLMPLMRRGSMQVAILALAVILYLLFAWSVPWLHGWVARHPLAAQLWMFEFPPWPWVSAPLIGLVCGWWWLDARRRGAERRYFTGVLLVGLACLAAYMAWEWWIPTTPGFEFRRDLVVNRHWNPRGMTNVLIAGTVATLLATMYWLQDVRRHRLTWLVVLGQTALVLYFLHQIVVYTLVRQALGRRFNDWTLYWTANVVLILLLVGIGSVWLRLRPRLRPLVRQLPGRIAGAVRRQRTVS